MIDERSRGIVLYALAAVVLLGGGVWFFRADPVPDESPELAAWRTAAEASLPDLPLQAFAETVVMASGGRAERTAPVDSGSYTLSMVCAGADGQVRVRLSSTGPDSGRAINCSAEAPEVDRIRVGLADDITLRLSAENGTGGAVFRWRLERARGL